MGKGKDTKSENSYNALEKWLAVNKFPSCQLPTTGVIGGFLSQIVALN